MIRMWRRSLSVLSTAASKACVFAASKVCFVEGGDRCGILNNPARALLFNFAHRVTESRQIYEPSVTAENGRIITLSPTSSVTSRVQSSQSGMAKD